MLSGKDKVAIFVDNVSDSALEFIGIGLVYHDDTIPSASMGSDGHSPSSPVLFSRN